jgi:hypothetical protein
MTLSLDKVITRTFGQPINIKSYNIFLASMLCIAFLLLNILSISKNIPLSVYNEIKLSNATQTIFFIVFVF